MRIAGRQFFNVIQQNIAVSQYVVFITEKFVIIGTAPHKFAVVEIDHAVFLKTLDICGSNLPYLAVRHQFFPAVFPRRQNGSRRCSGSVFGPIAISVKRRIVADFAVGNVNPPFGGNFQPIQKIVFLPFIQINRRTQTVFRPFQQFAAVMNPHLRSLGITAHQLRQITADIDSPQIRPLRCQDVPHLRITRSKEQINAFVRPVNANFFPVRVKFFGKQRRHALFGLRRRIVNINLAFVGNLRQRASRLTGKTDQPGQRFCINFFHAFFRPAFAPLVFYLADKIALFPGVPIRLVHAPTEFVRPLFQPFPGSRGLRRIPGFARQFLLHLRQFVSDFFRRALQFVFHVLYLIVLCLESAAQTNIGIVNELKFRHVAVNRRLSPAAPSQTGQQGQNAQIPHQSVLRLYVWENLKTVSF